MIEFRREQQWIWRKEAKTKIFKNWKLHEWQQGLQCGYPRKLKLRAKGRNFLKKTFSSQMHGCKKKKTQTKNLCWNALQFSQNGNETYTISHKYRPPVFCPFTRVLSKTCLLCGSQAPPPLYLTEFTNVVTCSFPITSLSLLSYFVSWQ